MSSKRITVFSWGYEGWGNATRKFVGAVDEVERKRGFRAPVFVDIRYSRSVRAIGFRAHAFEQKLGHARYRWMRSLGNANIRSGRGQRINCPDAAQQLLDLVIDVAAARKRVIFFCSCSSPYNAAICHRANVAKLLMRAARRRGIPVQIVEWPGGAPAARTVHRVKVRDAAVRAVLRGASAVPVKARDARDLASMPWGSMVELISPKHRQVLSSGPPQYRAGRWALPVYLFPVEAGDRPSSLLTYARRERSKAGVDPKRD